MKKLILLLLLIITLIGCGSNAKQKQDKIKNIITKEITFPSDFWNSKLLHKTKHFEVIENQTNYETFINELNSVLLEHKVSKTDINFDKSYILVYTTKYNAYEQIDEYQENIILENNSTATIKQEFISHKKDAYYSFGVQIRAYVVSKEIESIKMIHEDEISNISKEYPNGKPNTKVINILTTYTGGNSEENLLKLFDNNESFQNFIDNNYKNNIYDNRQEVANSLQAVDIDFDRYRVLFFRVLKGGITPLHYFREENSVTNITAEIKNSILNPKDMSWDYLGAFAVAMTNQIRVYIISRDIESIEISFPGESNATISDDEAI